MAEECAKREVEKTELKNRSYPLLRLTTVLLAQGDQEKAFKKLKEAVLCSPNKSEFFKNAADYWEYLESYAITKPEFLSFLEKVRMSGEENNERNKG